MRFVHVVDRSAFPKDEEEAKQPYLAAVDIATDQANECGWRVDSVVAVEDVTIAPSRIAVTLEVTG